MKNNHYIARLIFRHFPSKKEETRLYNLMTSALNLDIKIKKDFVIECFCVGDIEKEFNLKSEGCDLHTCQTTLYSLTRRNISTCTW